MFTEEAREKQILESKARATLGYIATSITVSDIRTASTLSTLRNRLKTHLFFCTVFAVWHPCSDRGNASKNEHVYSQMHCHGHHRGYFLPPDLPSVSASQLTLPDISM